MSVLDGEKFKIKPGLCGVRTNFLMDGVCWRYSNMKELQTNSWELYITKIIWFSPKCLKASCKYFCNLVSRMGEDNKHYTTGKPPPSHKSAYNIYFNFCIFLIKKRDLELADTILFCQPYLRSNFDYETLSFLCCNGLKLLYCFRIAILNLWVTALLTNFYL